MGSLQVDIVAGDLSRPEHQRDVLSVTAAYADDPMGTDAPLPDAVLGRLIEGLQKHPTTLLFLAYPRDGAERRAIGLATCFLGFSTFYARQLINIHDLIVLEEYRGRGVGRKLLEAVEEKARDLGCCKVTLEVHQNNHRAMRLYQSFGFTPVGGESALGGALFYSKVV